MSELKPMLLRELVEGGGGDEKPDIHALNITPVILSQDRTHEAAEWTQEIMRFALRAADRVLAGKHGGEIAKIERDGRDYTREQLAWLAAYEMLQQLNHTDSVHGNRQYFDPAKLRQQAQLQRSHVTEEFQLEKKRAGKFTRMLRGDDDIALLKELDRQVNIELAIMQLTQTPQFDKFVNGRLLSHSDMNETQRGLFHQALREMTRDMMESLLSADTGLMDRLSAPNSNDAIIRHAVKQPIFSELGVDSAGALEHGKAVFERIKEIFPNIAAQKGRSKVDA